MRIVTREDMRELDRRSIEDLGIPGSVLMDRAGCGLARWLEGRLRSFRLESLPDELLRRAKRCGFSVHELGTLLGADEEQVRSRRAEGATHIEVSWVPDVVGSPAPFYMGLGFVPTGKLHHGEAEAYLSQAGGALLPGRYRQLPRARHRPLCLDS